MTDELSKHQGPPAQMQTALDWLKLESGQAYDVERGLASLEKAVGASAIDTVSPSARHLVGWKVIGMIGVCALMGIATYVSVSKDPSVQQMGQQSVQQLESTGQVPSFAAPPPSTAVVPVLPVPSSVSSAVTVESLPATSLAGPRSLGNVGATPPVRPDGRKAAPSASEDSVHAELAHAARLRALAAIDPSAALREAAEGDRLFARGVLGEEREAIAIGALAKLGRMQEVRARAARYLAAHPTGPLAEEVRQLAGAGSSSSPEELP